MPPFRNTMFNLVLMLLVLIGFKVSSQYNRMACLNRSLVGLEADDAFCCLSVRPHHPCLILMFLVPVFWFQLSGVSGRDFCRLVCCEWKALGVVRKGITGYLSVT